MKNAQKQKSFTMLDDEITEQEGLSVSMLLAHLVSRYYYWKQEKRLFNNSFFTTNAKIMWKTSLTEHTLRKCMKRLEELNYITTKVVGIKAEKGPKLGKYYKINFKNLTHTIYTISGYATNDFTYSESTTSESTTSESTTSESTNEIISVNPIKSVNPTRLDKIEKNSNSNNISKIKYSSDDYWDDVKQFINDK